MKEPIQDRSELHKAEEGGFHGIDLTGEELRALGLGNDEPDEVSRHSSCLDGKGRCLDNVFVERLWRSVKYEEVFLYEYRSMVVAYTRLEAYFELYNERRPHSSLDGATPGEIYRDHLVIARCA
jgi:putative transposase